ncbi:MAG: hypothetical protein OXR73_25940 [Myxococcales bacterium]|nr:hypothetical protein [Myxococcales bacterium]
MMAKGLDNEGAELIGATLEVLVLGQAAALRQAVKGVLGLRWGPTQR